MYKVSQEGEPMASEKVIFPGEKSPNENSNSTKFETFKKRLESLKSNDKTIIQSLTIAAGANNERSEDIVNAILASSCNDLTKFYLLDSIIKIVGGPFVEVFRRNLVQRFKNVFLAGDGICKKKLFQLRQTWAGVISERTLFALDVAIRDIDTNWPITAKLNPDDSTGNIIVTSTKIKAEDDKDKFDGSHGVRRKTKPLLPYPHGEVNLNPDDSTGNIIFTSTKVTADDDKDKMFDGSYGVRRKSRAPPHVEHGEVDKKNQLAYGMTRIETKPVKIMPITRFLLDKIESNEKQVEARLAIAKYLEIEVGDSISFVCGDKTVLRTVSKKATYKTFQEMLHAEGMENCLPGVKSFDMAEAFYLQFSEYQNLQAKFGVVAFRLISEAMPSKNQIANIDPRSQNVITTSIKICFAYIFHNFPSDRVFHISSTVSQNETSSTQLSQNSIVYSHTEDEYSDSGDNCDSDEIPRSNLQGRGLRKEIIQSDDSDFGDNCEETDCDEIPESYREEAAASTPGKRKRQTKRQPKSPASPANMKIKRSVKWLPTKEVYHMSDELFNAIFDKDRKTLNRSEFLYRKDSIAVEINKIFPGCVIYVDKVNPAKKFFVLRAYCTHKKCRRYNLKSNYNDLQKFSIRVDSLNVTHLRPVTRQIRRYERNQLGQRVVKNFAHSVRERDMAKIDIAASKSGNFQVPSVCVYNTVRSEETAKQDNSKDDIDDVIKMQRNDDTNFISEVLPRETFGVYIHSKSQHQILHKCHVKRHVDGTPVVLRLDGSGDVARDIDGKKLLYHALTGNIGIGNDKTTTSFPFTEQYNSQNTSKDLAKWLFNFVLVHSQHFGNHPVIADYIISDFSFANFHAVVKVFNGKSLSVYLNLMYVWVTQSDEFPHEFYSTVKIRMCYTHLMKTFAEMCRRMFGKPASVKQHKHCRVIMELLSGMIQATDYNIVVLLWKQLVILLRNEFVTEDVDQAIISVNNILTPSVDWDGESFQEDPTYVDVEDLPEFDTTLYKRNLFYVEFEKYANDRNFFYNDKTERNVFFNPQFLDKFLKRFVPLIPLWTRILWRPSMKRSSSLLTELGAEPEFKPEAKLEAEICEELTQEYASDNLQMLNILDVQHNQPIETHFGNFKRRLLQKAAELGYPPVKLGRAIVESRSMIDAAIVAIETTTPKTGLNSQHQRKPYVRARAPPRQTKKQLLQITDTDGVDSQTFNDSRENYNKKRPLRQFNYMTPRSVPSIAKTKAKLLNPLQYKNGLSKFPEYYRNCTIKFVVAKNVDRLLFNDDFDLLHQQQEMSPTMMEYIANQLPKTDLQVAIIDLNETGAVKLIKNTVFVLANINRWVLFIVDKANKSYHIVNATEDNVVAVKDAFISRVGIPKTFKQKFVKCQLSSDNNSGVFCYHYMNMYINSGNISNRKVPPPESIRKSIEEIVLKNSTDMAGTCLLCGSESNEVDPNWGECTTCNRWLHCTCAEVTVQEVETNEDFQCTLCSASNV